MTIDLVFITHNRLDYTRLALHQVLPDCQPSHQIHKSFFPSSFFLHTEQLYAT